MSVRLSVEHKILGKGPTLKNNVKGQFDIVDTTSSEPRIL